jgi:hypothetical protein
MPRDARQQIADALGGHVTKPHGGRTIAECCGEAVLAALRAEGASACVLVWGGDGNVTVTPVEPTKHYAEVNGKPFWREVSGDR